MQQMTDGTTVSRSPRDMATWEIIGAYRAAWALAQYAPSGYLAKALANWQAVCQSELQRRG